MEQIKIRNKVLDIPIIQGGMGVGISLDNLAGNVAKNGGMGVISTAHPGYRASDFENDNVTVNRRELKKIIASAKDISEGKGIVAINAMVALSDYEGLIEAALEANVEAIISGAGLPMQLPKLVAGHDVLIAPIVSSGKAARLILKSWDKKYQRCPDFIVIEGANAGGHLGFKKDELLNHTNQSLMEIFNDVKETIKPIEEKYNYSIPVFVAGGIYTSNDIKQYLDQGVDGVQVATRFIGTHECDANIKYKEAFVNASKEDIELTISPVGMPGRCILTDLTRALNKGETFKVTKCYNCLIPCDVKTTPYCISKALIEAVKGNINEGLVFSGSNGYLIDKIVSVKELITELTEEL